MIFFLTNCLSVSQFPHICEFISFFFCNSFSASSHDHKKYFFMIYWDVFHVLTYGLSWRIFHVCLSRMVACILLLLSGMSVWCSLCIMLFKTYFLVGLLPRFSMHYWKWSIEISICYCSLVELAAVGMMEAHSSLPDLPGVELLSHKWCPGGRRVSQTFQLCLSRIELQNIYLR